MNCVKIILNLYNNMLFYLKISILKTMKIFLVAVSVILAGVAASAQEVVASSGSSGTITGYKVDWTLGEPVIETLTGSSNILTQGMHQTNLLVTGLQELEIPGLEVKVYPNPAKDFLMIEVTQTGNDLFRYELFDIAGRKAVVKKMNSNTEEIDMSSYVSGIYLLRVLSPGDENVKTCKIVKQ